MKKDFRVPYKIIGSITVEADSADEAKAIIDKMQADEIIECAKLDLALSYNSFKIDEPEELED